MAIDVKEPQSPGWWMNRLAKVQADQERSKRLKWLEAYYNGQFELPEGADPAREVYNAFQRKTRTNFAELIAGAVLDREALVGFRTAADDGETGDKGANDLWRRAECDVVADEVHLSVTKFDEAWVIVGPVDKETGAPTVTAEDPRQMVGEADPENPRRTRAAYKTFYDDVDEVSKAYLYVPGQLFVATSGGRRTGGSALRFNATTWSIDESLSGIIPNNRMPAVRFEANGGAGEFERHKDLIDRITDQILQRMVIATMQAFRQRAVFGLPPNYPAGHEKAGQPIDYNGLFEAAPGAVWQMPQGTSMWESGVADLNGILNAIKDDVAHLAAVTRTPMYMLMPEGANQSAEGASSAKESLIFKVENRIRRLTPSWARVMANMFAVMGDEQRADLASITPIWRSPERRSLAERASAVAQLASVMPFPTLMSKVMESSPDEVERMDQERVEEMLLQRQLVAEGAPSSNPLTPDPGAAIDEIKVVATPAAGAASGENPATG